MTATNFTPASTDVFDSWLSQRHWAVSELTYSFPENGRFVGYQFFGDVRPLSTAQKEAVERAFDDIASFTGLSFREVIEDAFTEATLRLAREPGLSGAYAYLPDPGERAGDAWFGSGSSNPELGTEAYVYFIHEIGHALGLDHGHEQPGFVRSGFDSQEFTVLTYSDYSGDRDIGSFDSGPVDWAQSYMQLDIAALQFLYGANFAARGEVWSGDTVYSFDPFTGEMSINGLANGTPAGNRIFRTIWDGHGEDTYDLSNYDLDLSIDLRPGAWSLFSDIQIADLNRFSASADEEARGNIANARLFEADKRSLIENAIGGSGDDRIRGNEGDNKLSGQSGNDVLLGLRGSDTIMGGAGNDRLIGANARDRLDGGIGDDILIGGNGNDLMFGRAGDDRMFGQAGRDRLNGGDGADVIKGGDGDDTLTGGRGADVLAGGQGRDVFLFHRVAESLASTPDRVVDFTSGADMLDFRQMPGGTFDLELNGQLTGTGRSIATRENGSNTRVSVDTNGDGQADMVIILKDVLDLTTSDFSL